MTAPLELREPILSDADARERIRNSLDETLVVEAAAGTGKTTELVVRLINVLADGAGSVESIAALTFSEKAAGELKLRLRAGLEEARHRAAPGSTRHVNLERAVAHLEEARISTIHGFCHDLLHERPVEATVDPQFRILPESEAEALYGRAFDEWLQERLEDPSEGLRRALSRSTRDRDESAVDRLRDAGWKLVGWRDLPAPWRRTPFARESAIDAAVTAVHELAADLATCSNTADYLYNDTWRARRLSADLRATEQGQPRDYDTLEAVLVELRDDWRFRKPRTGNARNYGRAVSRDEILARHRRLVEQLEDFARDANADLAALLQRELRDPIDRYTLLKARAGALDFLDLLLKARDLVRDRQEVRAELQRRLTHVFVDEFQDTDPLQAEILLLLAAADPAVRDWREVTPVPGKLFIVGDPKQSIYRFRRADIGMYHDVKTLLAARGATCVTLQTSFRAVPSIQGLVNAAFSPVMTEDRKTLQAGYVPLAHHRAQIAGQPGVVALPVPRPYGAYGLTKAEIDRSLPHAVGAFVDWLLTESGWTVTERDRPGETLPIAARHVCLLFRRFTSWGKDVTRPYVEALEARRVPHLLVGGKSFHLREEVESLRTALTAVEWPDDELSLYATLKGPLFAIPDEELLEYRDRFGRMHPYRAPAANDGGAVPERLRAIVDALALLRELHRRRNRRPIEETVTTLLAATRAHAGFVLRPWGEQALANIGRIADLARTYEASGGISFRGFIERLRDEADGEAPEAPMVEEGSEGVRIMTVHRAKGLEFPVVILADITANIASQHPDRFVDAERGLCAVRLAGCAPWDLLDHEADESARDAAEGVRLAYVAATRARDLLVVPAIGDDPFAGGWEAVDAGWIAPVHRAIYPRADVRRASAPAAGCPPFGEDSVLDRPDRDTPAPDNVRPGLHAFADDGYAVVWWDPGRLALDAEPALGIRRQDLIEPAAGNGGDAARAAYDEWQAARRLAHERGGRPSLTVERVTDWSRGASTDAIVRGDVTVESAETPGMQRSRGPRFGTLVHAVLATVSLDGTAEEIGGSVTLQARILGAPPEEIDAAYAAVVSALAHPLMLRARAAWAAGRCRREVPVAAIEPDGRLIEGVVDLAFEDDDGWVVVDFKTEAELGGGALPRYRRQVALYASIVARATGRQARGVLMRV